MDLKSTVRWFLTETHRGYFIAEISVGSHHSKKDLEIRKEFGGVHKIAAEIAEETGVYLYVNDLHTCTYAPLAVKRILPMLINEHGLRKVAEEIARQMQSRHLLIESREEAYNRYSEEERKLMENAGLECPCCPYCHSDSVSESNIGGGVGCGAARYYCWDCCQTFS